LRAGQLDSTDGSALLVARAHNDSVCPPNKILGTHRQFPAVPRTDLPKEFYAAIEVAKPKAKAKSQTKQEK
jgi:hypothetical protein